MLKTAIILETLPAAGGGYNQSISAIKQFMRITQGIDMDVSLYCTEPSVNNLLKELDLEIHYHKLSISDYLVSFLTISELGRRLLKRLNIFSTLERNLLKKNIDLVYFLNPTFLALSLRQINYVYTIWDACHQQTPEFPEVRNGVGHSRDFLYKKALSSAVLTLTDSDKLSELLVHKYNADFNRLLKMPFSCPIELPKENFKDISKFEGGFEDFFYYPAQYWPHKNHIRIIEALKHLKDKEIDVRVIFVGSDKGNLAFLKKRTSELNLQDQVRFHEFINSEDIISLYLQCKGVLMPSYFGFTNLPPLEAWYMERPLIYNQNFLDDSLHAALPIDPDSSLSIAEAIIKINNDQDMTNKLVEGGKKALILNNNNKKESEEKFLSFLKAFDKRTSNWR